MPRVHSFPADRAPTVVIGSGFGACLAAEPLVRAGERVIMLERGGWVPRGPSAWAPDATLDLTERTWKPWAPVTSTACVGGPSVFYGGVALRFRAEDFAPAPALTAGSGARWPVDYAALERHYAHAERLLDVAGDPAGDPSEPWRSSPPPQPAGGLSPVAERIGRAIRSVGLTPARLPLAMNHRADAGRARCVGCGTCDTFACAIGAKNDLATTLVPALVTAGMELRPHTLALRLDVAGGRVRAVHALDLRTWQRLVIPARRVVLAAGALGSAHLALASGLDRLSPAPDAVGAYLTRHCSAIVLGVFPRRLERSPRFHKQLGVHDLHAGDPDAPVAGPLGVLQQMPTPPAALVAHHAPRPLGGPARRAVPHLTGLLAMAQDQPVAANRVRIDAGAPDEHGAPRLVVDHTHTARDLAARDHLVGVARRVLRAAGAVAFHVHPIETFSHAAGTLRMGDDPAGSVVDPDGHFRGVAGLHVTDASVLPTPGSVNPSLTVAANAARIGQVLAAEDATRAAGTHAARAGARRTTSSSS